MKQTIPVLLILIIAFCCSCDDNDDDFIRYSGEGVVFGEIYGLCVGDCRQLFLLTDNALYSDADIDEYGDWNNTLFNPEPLSQSQFELAKTILQIPEELKMTNEDISKQIYSDIDYYLHFNSNSGFKTFVFDDVDENAANDIKIYIENLISIYQQLYNN